MFIKSHNTGISQFVAGVNASSNHLGQLQQSFAKFCKVLPSRLNASPESFSVQLSLVVCHVRGLFIN